MRYAKSCALHYTWTPEFILVPYHENLHCIEQSTVAKEQDYVALSLSTEGLYELMSVSFQSFIVFVNKLET